LMGRFTTDRQRALQVVLDRIRAAGAASTPATKKKWGVRGQSDGTSPAIVQIQPQPISDGKRVYSSPPTETFLYNPINPWFRYRNLEMESFRANIEFCK
jgi:hypothetical protein